MRNERVCRFEHDFLLMFSHRNRSHILLERNLNVFSTYSTVPLIQHVSMPDFYFTMTDGDSLLVN